MSVLHSYYLSTETDREREKKKCGISQKHISVLIPMLLKTQVTSRPDGDGDMAGTVLVFWLTQK